MKLIIKEYLSMLKESKELDTLLPDLLLSMEIKPIARPQIGVRQYGVDVLAVGKDKDGLEKVFLFTIKQGDIGRTDWDSGEQSVRQSLTEIIDVYIPTNIENKYSGYQKKIVLCTGGVLKQEVYLNWKGYIDCNTRRDIEFDFWGGDELAILVEQYLFNEQIIPVEFRGRLRKTIALLGDSDYDMSDYFLLLQDLLFNSNLKDRKTKQIFKTIRLIHLCLNLVFYWSKENNNLKPALYAAERTILNIWEFIRQKKCYRNKKIFSIAYQIYDSFSRIQNEYFLKVQQYLYVENGLSLYGYHFMEESILLFEQLGIIANIGNIISLDALLNNNNTLAQNAFVINDALKKMITNHKTLLNPVYDEHIIDIGQAISLLSTFGEIEFIDNWLHEMLEHIDFAYSGYGKYFPIYTDSFDDLVGINISQTVPKEESVQISTLLAVIMLWCMELGLIENYKLLKDMIKSTFKQTTLQVWYPDDSTDTFLYTKNAAYHSGFTDAPIVLSDKISDTHARINTIFDRTIKLNDLTCIKYHFPSLFFIASRHFRTPLFQILFDK